MNATAIYVDTIEDKRRTLPTVLKPFVTERPKTALVIIQPLKKPSVTPHYRPIPVPMPFLNDLAAVHALNGETDAALWNWSRSHTWRLIKSTMIEAGINPKAPYSTGKGLRHAFGLHAVSSGVPLNIVQLLMGHASMSTTAIYVDAVGDERRALVSRMWQGH